MRLDKGVRALIAVWHASGLGPASIRVRLLERFEIDVPYVAMVGHVDDLSPRARVGGRQLWHEVLGVEGDAAASTLDIDLLENEVRVRTRIVNAFQARARRSSMDDVIEVGRRLGRSDEFTRELIAEYRASARIRGERPREKPLDTEDLW